MIFICDAIDHLKEDTEVSAEMKYKIYFFRSGIHMMVKNYGYAIDDLNKCIKIIDKDEAHLKIAECYIAMDDTKKAKKIIEERMKLKNSKNVKENDFEKNIAEHVTIKIVDSNNIQNNLEIKSNDNRNKNDISVAYKEDTFEIFSKYNDKLEKIKKHEISHQQKIQNLEVFQNLKNEEKAKLVNILNERGVKLKQQFHKIPPNYEAKIFLDEQDNILHFPVLIVYEEFNVTDYLRDVEENSLISDILETLFEENLPADKDKKYNLNTVKCFLEMSDMDPVLKKEVNTYFPLRTDETLIEVLRHSKVHMNGIPVIFIVSQITKFYTHFIQSKAILNRNSRKAFNNITSNQTEKLCN